jgi:hypothetical protein
MSSKRRRAASRANGMKSRGPVTPEGKARSAANAPVTHGLASPHRAVHSVCLQNEDQVECDALYQDLVNEHAPVTTTEHLAVHEMAVARWRQNRALAMETALLDRKMDEMAAELNKAQNGIDEPTRAALAFGDLADHSSSLALLHRYENRLSRQFDRCLVRLHKLRAVKQKTNLPSEPNPRNGHLEDDHQFQNTSPLAASQPPIPEEIGHNRPAAACLALSSEVGRVSRPLQPAVTSSLSGDAAPFPRAA